MLLYMLRPGKLRVWGVTIHPNRCIVATVTKKEAVAAFKVSARFLDLYGSETFNEIERSVALNRPGVVFGRPYYETGPYMEVVR